MGSTARQWGGLAGAVLLAGLLGGCSKTANTEADQPLGNGRDATATSSNGAGTGGATSAGGSGTGGSTAAGTQGTGDMNGSGTVGTGTTSTGLPATPGVGGSGSGHDVPAAADGKPSPMPAVNNPGVPGQPGSGERAPGAEAPAKGAHPGNAASEEMRPHGGGQH